MAGHRISIRLYPESPDDALILEWLDGLPKGPNGKARVKQHIVSVLAGEIRGTSKTRRRATPAATLPKSPRSTSETVEKSPTPANDSADPGGKSILGLSEAVESLTF